jgi:hypothetical protein
MRTSDLRQTFKLPAASVLKLNSVPVTLLPAPGANKMIVVHKATFIYDYGSAAFGGIAAGEDLQIRYTNASGVLVMDVETTGFLDQTNDETRIGFPNDATVAVPEIDGAPDNINELVCLCLASGDITGGTASTLQVTIDYSIVDKV